MADQLAGQWYADAFDLPPVATPERIRQALATVYANNVLRFSNGRMGAVNGISIDGRVPEDEQAAEVWPGVTHALAALMMHNGMQEEALATAFGAVDSVWGETGCGLFFRTPEAWDANCNYRSSMYMRAGSIWGIWHAYQKRRGQ